MKKNYPATQRNQQPILEVLQRILPDGPITVLEVASGSGQHGLHFVRAMSHVTWQPSDIDDVGLASIEAWRADSKQDNLLAPVRLDATDEEWPVAKVDAIFSANMVHISPWAATLGLLAGAGRVLKDDGLLILYGPYRITGRKTAESNEAFDESLQGRDPAWGLRKLDDVIDAAAKHGLLLKEIVDMPANNVTVVFERV